jgi:threonylcarbamoyladenosine tRNA methylthiotransferase MtaB
VAGYCLLTFGCRVNQADSLELERDLRASGFHAEDPERADVIVVNTCSVTATADQGARQTIRRCARDNPRARIIVTGCYATRAEAEIRELPSVVCTVTNPAKGGLAREVLHELRLRATVPLAAGAGSCGADPAPGLGGRTMWTLRVQTGCDEPCAFCVIPRTRGRSRSRPLEEVLAEVDRAARDGYLEMAFTGVHLGAWGRDLVPPAALEDLLAAVAAHPAPVVVRVSSLEPRDCTHAVREVLASSPKFAPHFHLPLQHPSDRLLRAMRRPYDLGSYAALVGDVRARWPEASIGSDVLVGFPGETDDDHMLALAWLEQSPLTHLHVFPYSDRPGTEAASMVGRVHGTVVRRRAEDVRRVGRALSDRFRAAAVGSVRPGLTTGDGTLVVTDNYLKVSVPPGVPRNRRVRVRIVGAGEPMRGIVEQE